MRARGTKVARMQTEVELREMEPEHLDRALPLPARVGDDAPCHVRAGGLQCRWVSPPGENMPDADDYRPWE